MTEPLDPDDALGVPLAEKAVAPEQRTLFKTLVGVAWMYGGRGVGLLWTLALIGKLSIGDYGLYAMAFAVATILGPTLDNPWNVRAMRESEDRFLAERASRYLVGATLMAAGAALIPFTFIGFLGLVVAGGDMVFNSYISRDIRDGHPDRVYKWSTSKQLAGVTLAATYLFTVHDPTLFGACALYCVPYVVILVLAGFSVLRHRPALPGSLRLMAILMGEMGFGTTLYLQGDVLLLGWLTNTTTVGYYNIALMVTSALAAVGQSFAMTYHEPLRKSGGDLSTAPKLRTTLIVGAAAGLVTLVIGVGLLLSPAPTVVAYSMFIMAGFAGLRSVIAVFQVILYAQRRDRLRFTAAVTLIPFKFLFLAVLVWMGLGAIGASIATTTADAALLAVFAVALYWRRKEPAS